MHAMTRPVRVAMSIAVAVDSPWRRRYLEAVIGALTIIHLIETKRPFHAAHHTADHTTDYGSDRTSGAIADGCSVCRSSGHALGLCGHRESEYADERASHQDLLVH
jgi:hypothetical protein